jgi:aspartate racemase
MSIVKARRADLAVIPAATPHLCIRELLARSSFPVLNLFDPLVKELLSHSVKRLGVFGTRFVVESALFGVADGVDLIRPTNQTAAEPGKANHIQDFHGHAPRMFFMRSEQPSVL